MDIRTDSFRDVIEGIISFLEAGFTLREAVAIVAAENSEANVHRELNHVLAELDQGNRLDEAFSSTGLIEDTAVLGMLKVGERTGEMTEALKAVVRLVERRSDIQEKVTLALIYPAFLCVVGLGAAFCMDVFVLPRLAGLFADTGGMPFITRIVMTFFRVMTLLALVCAAGVFFFRKSAVNTGILMVKKIPYIRRMMDEWSMSLFFSTVGLMLSRGFPTEESVRNAAALLPDQVLSARIAEASHVLAGGEYVSTVLDGTGVFPGYIIRGIMIGEKTGSLPVFAQKLAGRLEKKADCRMKILTSYVEPALVLMIGAAMGLLVVSILVPVMTMEYGF